MVDSRPPPTHVPLRRLVPNFITTAALCSGLASLHFAHRAPVRPELWDKAVWAIALAAIFDALDGRAARLLRVASPFGATLDSIADFVSFCLAPAFLIYQLQLKEADLPGFAACALYCLCGALRLARFTAMARRGRTGAYGPAYFVGLPTPAAAGAVLIPPMLSLSDRLGLRMPDWFVIVYTGAIALLMISRLPLYSFKGLHIGRGWVIPLMVLVGVVVVGMMRDSWITASVLAAVYLLTLPASLVTARRVPKPRAGRAALRARV